MRNLTALDGIFWCKEQVQPMLLTLFNLIIYLCRPTDAEARIVKIRSNGFIVFVPK